MLFPELNIGDTTRVTVEHGNIVEVHEIKLIQRVSAEMVIDNIRKSGAPIPATSLPRYCRWVGSKNEQALYIFELPPREVKWTFQKYLDPDEKLVIPVTLPYQIHTLTVDRTSQKMYNFSAAWSKKPIATDSLKTHEIMQFHGPNITMGAMCVCLGNHRINDFTGVDALFTEMIRSFDNDKANTDMSQGAIFDYAPEVIRNVVIPDEGAFGFTKEEINKSQPVIKFGVRFGLWCKSQENPKVAVCQLPWYALGTLHQIVGKYV